MSEPGYLHWGHHSDETLVGIFEIFRGHPLEQSLQVDSFDIARWAGRNGWPTETFFRVTKRLFAGEVLRQVNDAFLAQPRSPNPLDPSRQQQIPPTVPDEASPRETFEICGDFLSQVGAGKWTLAAAEAPDLFYLSCALAELVITRSPFETPG